MHTPRTPSPLRPARRTSGATRPLAAALALAAAVVGTLSIPSESRASDSGCYCPGGTDFQGHSITSTTCGEQVCGADFQWYACQESGWSFEGGSCGSSSSCSCTGTDYVGNTVTVNACGQQVCGADFHWYSCEETGWTTQGLSCPYEPPSSSCSCPNGTDFLGNPVSSTTCGEQVCGADFQFYSCGETGWSAQGSSCPSENVSTGLALPTLTPLDAATITATIGLDPTDWGVNSIALQNQLALSNARVRLGRAMHMLDFLPETASEAQRSEILATLSIAQSELEDLLVDEAMLPAEQRERARLPVFITRLSQLETQYAFKPGYAIQLARQTYYNGEMYSAASGAPFLPHAMIHMTGLPHGSIHPDANGGYIADIRAPNGEKVDFGHVLCAVDFNAPYPRVGSIETGVRNIRTYGGSPLPNPANHGGMLTLAGDLGTAANDYMLNGHDAWAALMAQGHSDMRGDVDGLNLSAIISNNGWFGTTPVASALISYYYGNSFETYTSRAQIFIDTSPYILRLGSLYTASWWFAGDVQNVAVVFSLMGGHGFSGGDGVLPVVSAFQDWLGRELAGLNPPTDGG